MSPDLATVSRNIPSDGNGNLSRYLRQIQRFPILSADEEVEFARQWRDHGDLEAAHKLVTSHLRLVAKIALDYREYDLQVGELIDEDNVGMMQAVRPFDPDRGFRLATYAMWWIRAAIQEYVMHSYSLVKMGTKSAQKKLFFNMRRLKSDMQVIGGGDLTVDQVSKIATILKVTEQDVIDMNRRLAIRPDDDGERQDWLTDEIVNQKTDFADREELASRKALLPKALEVLNARERHILTERRLKDKPYTYVIISEFAKITLWNSAGPTTRSSTRPRRH